MLNSTIKTYSRIMACALALVTVLYVLFGNGVFDTQTVAAASSQVVPTQARTEEKPYVNIVTNVVVNAAGKPTGYVELALLVKTPKVGDGDAAVQTTFRNLAVTLEYNDELLVPVSWDHEIRYSDDGTSVINCYPDFVDSYNDIDLETATEAEVIARAAKVNSIFNSAAQYSIPLNALQHETALEGDIAFVGGPKPLLSLSASSTTDLVLLEETPLAVVRFLYTGTDLETVVRSDTTVDPDMITSGHDEQGNSDGAQLKSLFWFADDADMDSSPTNQALYYTSGDYVGLSYGENNFYATKVMYNGSEVALPGYIDKSVSNYMESSIYKDAAGDQLDRPLTGVVDETSDDFDLDRKVVKAVSTDDSATEETNGYYSYTSNLLFTSDSKESKTAVEQYDDHTNIRFGVVAQESFRSTGGVDISQVTTVVFLDWDDTILGALAVVKGDARASINAYVENFIHPSLRFSNPDNANDLEALATSLERQYTYAGKYNNTDDNGDGVFDSGAVTDGDSYPLTNKLDYAFMRRPVISSDTYKPPADDDGSWPYRNAAGKAVEATEWKTGTVDWANGDYPYIYGWAIVDDPSKADSVWTTFSGAGELDGIKLPGYDTNGDNDGYDQFHNNIIRAAEDSSGTNPRGGVYSAIDSSEISFASYADSAYFRFADFSDLADSPEAIFVKACYEPGESLNWTEFYSAVSEPYYVRNGTNASTQEENTYTISFTYERISSGGVGVLRARQPWLRIQYNFDENIVTGQKFTFGSTEEQNETIKADINAIASFYDMTYTLVEVYGRTDYIASIDRSENGNEAEVLTNFKYLTDESLEEGYQNGFKHGNHLGSDGFIYQATLQQILEEGTRLCAGTSNVTENVFLTQYLSSPTLLDLNLYLQEGIPGDGTGLGILDQATARSNAQNAIYDAIKIAYDRGVLVDGVVDLEWHQLQYHIFHWKEDGNGIATPGANGGTIRAKADCGNYAWCKQDACSEVVNVPVNNLSEALEAALLSVEAGNTATKEAAIAELKKNLVSVLTGSGVISGDGGKTTKSEAIASGKYAVDETTVSGLIAKLQTLVQSAGTALTPGQVQNWLISGTDYTDPEDDTNVTAGYGDLQYTYWWLYWDNKPYEIDFSEATAANAVDLLAETVASAASGNPLAWNALSAETIAKMRFVASDRGDFFLSVPEGYSRYMSLLYDTRTELVLGKYETSDEIETFITRVTAFMQTLVTDDNWDKDSLIATLDSYGWESVQYYLINNAATSNPEYYASADDSDKGVYWWKSSDLRLWINSGADAATYDYVGATLTELQEKLANYVVVSGGTREGLKKQFLIWFTPEVAADLIIRDSRERPIVSTLYSEQTANLILDLALEHAGLYGNAAVSNLTWSQIQYYIVNGSYASNKKAQNEYTYSGECEWAYINNDVEQSNRWREQKVASITELKALLQAIDAYATDPTALNPVEAISDLAEFDFRVPEGFVNNAANIHKVLTDMKAAYNTAAGDVSAWTTLAESVETPNESELTPRDAWYLVQYYLYNKEFPTDNSGAEISFAPTINAAKEQYWWEYGWSGSNITSVASLRAAIMHGVSSRIAIITDGTSVTADLTTSTQHLQGLKNTTLSWNDPNLKAALTKLCGNTQIASNVWWAHLQFLILHTPVNSATVEAAVARASNESAAFYWWYDAYGVTKPTFSLGTWSDGYSDVEANRTKETAEIMRAALLYFATGNDNAEPILTAENVAKYINIRDAANADSATVRDPDGSDAVSLAQYTDDDYVLGRLEALVKAAYEAAAPNDGWDYVTDDGVYTYNQAAYNAVLALTPVQIQHWFTTGTLVTDASELEELAKTYWWLASATKPAGDDALHTLFVDFYSTFIRYAIDYNSGNTAAATDFRTYYNSDEAKEIMNTLGLTKTTQTANNAKKVLVAVYEIYTRYNRYDWNQLQYAITKRTYCDVGGSDYASKIPEAFQGKVFEITLTLNFTLLIQDDAGRILLFTVTIFVWKVSDRPKQKNPKHNRRKKQ